jgi:hypothetical protein
MLVWVIILNVLINVTVSDVCNFNGTRILGKYCNWGSTVGTENYVIKHGYDSENMEFLSWENSTNNK